MKEREVIELANDIIKNTKFVDEYIKDEIINSITRHAIKDIDDNISRIDLNSFEDDIESDISHCEITDEYESLEFLKDNDINFQKSLTLAKEEGYKISELSSTILATLLLRDILRKEASDVVKQINDTLNM